MKEYGCHVQFYLNLFMVKNSIETFQSEFLCVIKTDQNKSQNSSKHTNNCATLKCKQGEINQMNDCIKCFSMYFLCRNNPRVLHSLLSINKRGQNFYWFL